jgi:hypothetical protein
MGPPPPAPPQGAWHPLWFLLGFYAAAAAWAFAWGSGLDSPALGLAASAATAVCLGCWALADARRRGHPVPAMSRTWFVVFAAAVVPGYAVWSRGWRGAGWAALAAAGWAALSFAAALAGGVLAFLWR